MSEARDSGEQYRQAAELVTGAAGAVTTTVQRMHTAIARHPFRLTGRPAAPVRHVHDTIAALVYGSVRAGITASGTLAATAAGVLGQANPGVEPAETSVGRTAIGMLAGAFGEIGPDASTAMTVRVDGHRVPLERPDVDAAFPDATSDVVVFLHGLIETERWWYPRQHAEQPQRVDFGTRLATDLGSTPVYVRYGSGRHISDNGRELDALLDDLVAVWPTEVRRISIVGHSMGGLVARSAAHQAAERQSPWVAYLAHVVCLGSPHTGAPLEFGAHVLSWGLRRLPEAAPLGDLLERRSPGIKDLRYGYLHEQQWRASDPDRIVDRTLIETTVPAGVRLHFVSATMATDGNGLLGRIVGDALVTPTSAQDYSQAATRHRVSGRHHFALLHDDEVYERIRSWLDDGVASRATTQGRTPRRLRDRLRRRRDR